MVSFFGQSILVRGLPRAPRTRSRVFPKVQPDVQHKVMEGVLRNSLSHYKNVISFLQKENDSGREWELHIQDVREDPGQVASEV